MSRSGLFTIGEFSKVTGIGIHSLRYYDEVGALKPEYVDPVSNYRYYSFSQLSLIPAINICLDAGINLGDFSSYVVDNKVDYMRLLNEGRKSLDSRIEECISKKHMFSQMENYLKIKAALEDGREITTWLDSLTLWTIPCSTADLTADASGIILKLSNDAKRNGLFIDPVCYGLMELVEGGTSRIFAFAFVRDAGDGRSYENMFNTLPGTYLIKSCESCSLESARAVLAGSEDRRKDNTLYAVCFTNGTDKKPLYFAAARTD